MMAEQTIYARTRKGDEELKARQSQLGAVVNGMLMLVNGRRSRDDLMNVANRLGARPDCLDDLASRGFIELHTAPAPVAVPVAAALERLPADAHTSDADCSGKLYAHLIGAAKKHLGLKGFLYHLKVEKAVTLAERRALIEPLAEAMPFAFAMASPSGSISARRSASVTAFSTFRW